MLTVSEDGVDLVAALRAGACGYLLKNIDADILIDAIRRAARGESVVSAELTGKLVAGVRDGPALAQTNALGSLSPCERDIVTHIAAGSSNKEIARLTGLAESTVKIHVQHVMRKLKLGSRVRIAFLATEVGSPSERHRIGARARDALLMRPGQQRLHLEGRRDAFRPLVDQLVHGFGRVDLEDDDRAATQLGVDVLGGARGGEWLEPIPESCLIRARRRRLVGARRADDEEMHGDSDG